MSMTSVTELVTSVEELAELLDRSMEINRAIDALRDELADVDGAVDEMMASIFAAVVPDEPESADKLQLPLLREALRSVA